MIVMVVDDDKVALQKNAETLSKRRVAAVTVLYRTGRKAAEYAASNPVDMVFARARLPDMSGEELLERIRFRQPITKGYLMDEDEEILVSPRGDISVGLPILYPWEEEDRKKPETARRTPKPLGTARTKRASKPATVAIVIFLGGLGIHRFLAGKTGTGILWLLTIGCLGIGWIVDIIQVSAGRFTQKDGMLWGTG